MDYTLQYYFKSDVDFSKAGKLWSPRTIYIHGNLNTVCRPPLYPQGILRRNKIQRMFLFVPFLSVMSQLQCHLLQTNFPDLHVAKAALSPALFYHFPRAS